MNRSGLILAIAVVVVSNIFVLMGIGINRAGAPFQAIELTERELTIQTLPEDNSGISMRLNWAPYQVGYGSSLDSAINAAKLQELGFDCSIPADPNLHEQRLPPRVAYAVLEYEGPARENWLREKEDFVRTHPLISSQMAGRPVPGTSDYLQRGSRLFVVDAGRKADNLRRKYPDPQRYLIVRAVIAARLYVAPNTNAKAANTYSWHGWVSELLPSEIFVPLPYAKTFWGMGAWKGTEPRYSVTVQYGRNLEPWISDARLAASK